MKISTALRRIRQEFPPEIVEIFEAGLEANRYNTLGQVMEILNDCQDFSDEGTEPPSETIKALRNLLT